MADDPVEKYLNRMMIGYPICDCVKDMGKCTYCAIMEALTPYRSVLAELVTTKAQLEKVTEANTDFHNSWSKMGVELLKVKAELAQVKAERDRYKSILEYRKEMK